MLQRYPLSASLGIVLPVVIYAIVWRTPYFETNDDVWMMLTLSGQVSSLEPTASVLYMNVFLCRLLAGLYRIAGFIPWYGLLHIGSIAAALWAMAYVLIVQEVSYKRLCVFLLCLVSFGLPSLIALQFTKTSVLVGLGGLFLLYGALVDGAAARSGRQVSGRLIAAGALLVLGFMIRDKSLYLLLIVSAPLLCSLAWQTWGVRTWKIALTSMISIGGVLFILNCGHEQIYRQDPEWERFILLDSLKSRFIDFGGISYNAETRPYFADVGWSETDYRMLRRWFYVDSGTYSPEKLQAIVEHFPLMSSAPLSRLGQALATLFPLLWNDGVLPIAALLVVGIALLEIRKRSLFLVLFTTVGTAFSVMIVLLAFFHLPARVYQPTVMAVCWLTLLLVTGHAPPRNEGKSLRVLGTCGMGMLAVLLLLLLLSGQGPLRLTMRSSELTVHANRELRASLSLLAPRPSQTFVVWGAAFPFESVLPLERTDYMRGFRVVGLGASNQSPVQRRMLEAQGISDLHRALFERDDVFLCFRPNLGREALLVAFLMEHYNVHARLIPSFQDGPLRFWKVARSSTESAQCCEEAL